MTHKRLALTMIVKDETNSLERCLKSVAPYVDDIFILRTSRNKETKAVCDAYSVISRYKNIETVVTRKDVAWLKRRFGWKPTIEVGEKLFFFDTARNEAMKMIPKDYKYFMWLDADDIVQDGKRIPELLDLMDTHHATAVFMNYLYDVEVDEKGAIKQVLIEHLRERILLNDGRYHWVAPIHETLISKTGEVHQIETKDIQVVHIGSNNEKKAKAIWRNIKNLEKDIADKKASDPRPIYYLAKAYYDLHTEEYYKKAEKLIYIYLNGEYPSGWTEERAQAWEYLAEIYRERKEYNKAIKAALNALTETNKFPSTFLSLGISYMYKEDWDGALTWLKIAGNIPMPKTTLVINPRDMIARSLEILMNCNLKLNKLDEAWAASVKLLELFPKDAPIANFNKMLTDIREQRELTKAYVQMAKFLELRDDPSKIKAFIQATPRIIRENPIVAELIKKYNPPTVWGEKEVVIYCGPGWTLWNPALLKEPGANFMGGSEEAVIYASRELTRLGYHVTVYGDPGEEGDYEGVTYKHYFSFNPEDTFNILIGWRVVQFFDRTYKAKKTYLWLHDVPNPVDFTKERVANITKIMCLSKAQRTWLPDLPDSKFFITSNGIHEEYPKITPTNNPTQCIWTSSYDRGLQHLLEIWPDVVKAVPKATLKVYYGWQLFNKFYANNPERKEWQAKMEKMMTHKGITHGGRLPQHLLEKEYKASGVWAYPTDFFEINCISAIKAQAYGATPICTDHAALSETVTFGTKVKGDIWDSKVKERYKKTLIKALQHPMLPVVRQEMMKETKEKYAWSTIVTSWIQEYETL